VYQDISESILALKKFLSYRESHSEFDKTKEKGAVGLPCIVVNDGERIILGFDEEVLGSL